MTRRFQFSVKWLFVAVAAVIVVAAWLWLPARALEVIGMIVFIPLIAFVAMPPKLNGKRD